LTYEYENPEDKFKIIKDKMDISSECVGCRSELIWWRENEPYLFPHCA